MEVGYSVVQQDMYDTIFKVKINESYDALSAADIAHRAVVGAPYITVDCLISRFGGLTVELEVNKEAAAVANSTIAARRFTRRVAAMEAIVAKEAKEAKEAAAKEAAKEAAEEAAEEAAAEEAVKLEAIKEAVTKEAAKLVAIQEEAKEAEKRANDTLYRAEKEAATIVADAKAKEVAKRSAISDSIREATKEADTIVWQAKREATVILEAAKEAAKTVSPISVATEVGAVEANNVVGVTDVVGGSVYLYRWEFNGRNGYYDSFLKFGITTRDHEKRIKEQSRETGYKATLIVSKAMPTIEEARNLETTIKRTLVCGVVDKDVFSDGYTETLEDNMASMEALLKILV